MSVDSVGQASNKAPIEFDDFVKVEMRVGTILEAELNPRRGFPPTSLKSILVRLERSKVPRN